MYENNLFEPSILKIGSNRSVQSVCPGIGDESGWVNLSNPLLDQNRSKIEKTRLNRPIQSVGLVIGDEFGWVNLSKSLVGQNRSKIGKTRLNRLKSFEPKNRSRFRYTVWFRKIHQIDHFVKKKCQY